MSRVWWMLFLCLRLPAADLTLVFAPRWAGAPIAVPSPAVANAAGQSLRVTRFSALISGVTLVRVTGEQVQLNGQYGFIDAAEGRMSVTLGDVPPGDYAGLGFSFGLPASVNHADPGSWGPSHPLNPLVNHLHWSWRGGYVFVALEGHWDADGAVKPSGKAHSADEAAASADASDRGFSYHLAGDDLAMPVRFAVQFSVEARTTVTLAVDLARVLRDNVLAAGAGTESTHSASGDAFAAGLARSVTHAMFWLGAESGAGPAALASGPARNAPATPGTPSTAHPLAFTVPAGFPAPQLPQDNPLTREGVELGRQLFTDRRLSRGQTQSCASCHDPAAGFSDTMALSRGADGHRGVRNAMPLFNLAWASAYAWDGGKNHVRDQAIAAMTNPIEMHADVSQIVRTLSADAEMTRAFRAAFGAEKITPDRIGLALEQYLLTLVSADSKFDRAARGEVALTEEEKEGFALFTTEYDPGRGRRGADCFHCHGGALFTDYDFKNNGLAATRSETARAGVTGRSDDVGKFKTPSLRNVAITGPYMHDGRFATLADVIAHYDHGVIRSATLDPNLAKHPDAGLQLTTAEQKALEAFLRTLTDARWDKPPMLASR